MKRAVLFLATGGILAAAALCVAAAAPGPSGDSATIDQLKKEIGTLRERVDSLEKRLDEQGQSAAQMRVWPPTTPDPNSLLQPRSVPKSWRQFEFNGRPYYVLPVDGSTRPASGK